MTVDLEAILKRAESPDEDERQAALLELVLCRDMRAIPGIQKIAATDPSVKLRYQARKALYVLKTDAEEESAGSTAVPEGTGTTTERHVAIDPERIGAILDGEDPVPKMKLLQSAVKYQIVDIIEPVRARATQEPSKEVRATMAITLGILGSKAEIPTILHLLEDPDLRVRANAIEALEFIGHPSSFAHLIRFVSDPDNRIRANAIKALRGYGKVNVHKLLAQMLNSRQVGMRDSAAHALVVVNSREFLPLIKKAIEDSEPSVQAKGRQALERLVQRGHPEAVAFASQLAGVARPAEMGSGEVEEIAAPSPSPLTDPDREVRWAEVERIIHEKDTRSLPSLVRRLFHEPDEKLRASIVVALGKIGNATLQAVLAGALEDPVPRVRANAIEALTAIRAPDLVSLVKPLLEDSNNRVRANAIVALKRDYDVNIVGPLSEMVYSPEVLHRKSAFYALTDINDLRVLALLQTMVVDPDPDLRSKAVGFLAQVRDQGGSTGAEIDRWVRTVRTELASGAWTGGLEELKQELAAPGQAPASGAGPATPEPATEPPGGTDQGGPSTDGPSVPGSTPPAQEAPPAPPPAAAGSTGAFQEEHRKLFRYESFRHATFERKRSLLEQARGFVNAHVYFFLKEVEQKESFDVKVLAKFALKNFHGKEFGGLADAQEEDLSRLIDACREPRTVEYRGHKTVMQLGQDLAARFKLAQGTGLWKGPFDQRLQILNALREDTQDMITDLVGDETVQRVSICFYQPKVKLFLQAERSLDSNLYEQIITLVPVITRLDHFNTMVPFLRSVKMPTYLLVLLTDKRVVLFLRGWLGGKTSNYLSIPYRLVTRVEETALRGLVTLRLQVGPDFMEIPELEQDEAAKVAEIVRKESLDKIQSEERFIDIDFQEELKKLELLRSARAISDSEYVHRRERILKMDREKFSQRNVEKILTRRYKDDELAARVDPQLLERFRTELTIMFTDIVGYSRKAAEKYILDVLTILAIHDSILLPRIKGHSGNLIKKMGDALMVSFKDPVDAIRSAIDMQKALTDFNEKNEDQILIRIGINTGSVFVKDGDIFGEAVNLAARMEPLAEPGKIVLTERTQELVTLHFRCEDKGEREVKGFPQPVRIYNVVP